MNSGAVTCHSSRAPNESWLESTASHAVSDRSGLGRMVCHCCTWCVHTKKILCFSALRYSTVQAMSIKLYPIKVLFLEMHNDSFSVSHDDLLRLVYFHIEFSLTKTSFLCATTKRRSVVLDNAVTIIGKFILLCRNTDIGSVGSSCQLLTPVNLCVCLLG